LGEKKVKSIFVEEVKGGCIGIHGHPRSRRSGRLPTSATARSGIASPPHAGATEMRSAQRAGSSTAPMNFGAPRSVREEREDRLRETTRRERGRGPGE
jgi:hypothetical protein